MIRNQIALTAISFSIASMMLVSCAAAPVSSTAISSAEPASSEDKTNSQFSADKNSSEVHLYVKDIEGNTQDLAEFSWAKKYPWLLDSFSGREEDLKNFVFYTIADENITPKGETSEFDIWGQRMSVTVQSVERGNNITCIPDEKISQGKRFLGDMENGQEYLAVTLLLTNKGNAPLDLYLNNVSLRCAVDGQKAKGGPIGSEAVTSDLPLLPDSNTNQFQVILESGESRTCSILYYINTQIETNDIYLYANFPGYGTTGATTAFNQVSERWLALG